MDPANSANEVRSRLRTSQPYNPTTENAIAKNVQRPSQRRKKAAAKLPLMADWNAFAALSGICIWLFLEARHRLRHVCHVHYVRVLAVCRSFNLSLRNRLTLWNAESAMKSAVTEVVHSAINRGAFCLRHIKPPLVLRPVVRLVLPAQLELRDRQRLLLLRQGSVSLDDPADCREDDRGMQRRA